MTPDELIAARRQLRMKAIDLGRALELEGKDPGRAVRQWEAGGPMPGPARVAVRLMLEAHARQTLQEALQTAQAYLAPPEGLEAAQDPPSPTLEVSAPGSGRARRRG